MEQYKSQQKRPNKREHALKLLNTVTKWIREGEKPIDALGKLSERQYDVLCDVYGEEIDKLTLTAEQLKTVNEIKRTPRPTFPNGYKKKYPATKQAFFNNLVEFLKTQAETVTLPEKINYRDIDFSVNGTKYHIVLSQPRTAKSE